LLPPATQRQFLESLTPQQLNNLQRDWRFWARDAQILPPGDWSVWLIIAGRGWGKTRSGAEGVCDLVEQGYRSIALVGRTVADVRQVMVEGPISGILACARRRGYEVLYEPSKRKLTWPNGAVAYTYSGDKPDQLRGPEHDAAWVDELAAWRYPESWDMLLFGLRIGIKPVVIATTTPRPVKHIRDLLASPTTHITRGRTLDNAANLSPIALKKLLEKYQGTRLGRQELDAELLDDVPGALWTRSILEKYRVRYTPVLVRIVVAIDPAASVTEDSAETGIIVAGIDRLGEGYVIDDLTLKGSPDTWAKAAVDAYRKYQADMIVGEANNGGDMVESTIRTVDKNVPFKKVWASRGKYTRAEPVSALYEQGKVHHVGTFAELEDQYCTWVPGEDSPDRMDAAVWALTELMLEEEKQSGMRQAKTKW
jgi:phage terminase large subunit-like protein